MRMPATEVDGMTLLESLAIFGYLDERDPIAPLPWMRTVSARTSFQQTAR